MTKPDICMPGYIGDHLSEAMPYTLAA